MSDLSERILSLITKNDISYGDLSKLTNIPKSALQRYATGETEKIPINRIKAIANALNVSAAYIMGWEDNNTDRSSIDRLELSAHEKKVINAYRDHPEMQKPVDRLLGVEEETVHIIPIAARNGKNEPLNLTDSELEALKNLPDVPPEL